MSYYCHRWIDSMNYRSRAKKWANLPIHYFPRYITISIVHRRCIQGVPFSVVPQEVAVQPTGRSGSQHCFIWTKLELQDMIHELPDICFENMSQNSRKNSERGRDCSPAILTLVPNGISFTLITMSCVRFQPGIQL